MTKPFRTLIVAAIAVLVAVAIAVVWRVAPRKLNIVEYKMLAPTDIPTAVAVGADGTAWFTIDFAEGVGLIKDGKMQRVPKAGRNVEPIGIAVDAGGAAWLTDPAKIAVSRITADGNIQSFPLGTPIARLGRLAIAPDGAVWFAESTAYSITSLKDGVVKRHQFESVQGGPYGVSAASDGTIWATLQAGNQLLRISPNGEMKAFDLPTPGAAPTDVAAGLHGDAWMVEFRSSKIAHFDGSKFTEYDMPEGKAAPSGIAVTPDGTVWFGLLRGDGLGRLVDGKAEFIALPRASARPYTLAADRAGNVWYADISGYVGMIAARK